MTTRRPSVARGGVGGNPQPQPRPAAAFNVLLVCTGNVSRSPAGQLLLQSALAGPGAPRIGSAGTHAQPGQTVDPEMLHRLGERAPSSFPFASRLLKPALVASADLVLGMTRQHCTAAVQLVPSAVRSTFTLEEFAWLISSAPDLEDPLPEGSGNRLRVAVRLAEARRVFFRLGADRDEDIPDPIGRSTAAYDRTFERISTAIATISGFASSTSS